MVEATNESIRKDYRGIPYIVGTSMKVMTIVIDAYTWSKTPLEIQDNYPRLSLSQIQAALDYYRHDKASIDKQILEWDREYELIRASDTVQLSKTLLKEKLDHNRLAVERV